MSIAGLADVIDLFGGGSFTAEAAGVEASAAIGPEGPILVILGGVLTELLGNNNATAQRVQQAINTALAANVAGNTQNALNFGAATYGAWKANTTLLEDTSTAAFAAAGALVRLKTRLDAVQAGTAGAASQADLAADVNGIEAQLEFLTNFFNTKTDAESQARIDGDEILNSYAEQLYNLAIAHADAQAAGALAQAVLESRTDAQSVEAWVTQIVGEVNTEFSTLIAQLDSALTQLEAYVTNGLTAAEGYAQTAAEAGLTSLQTGQNQQLVSTLSPGWAGLAESANTATETLVQEHPEEAGNLNLIPSSVPSDAPAAIAGLAVGLKTVTQALNDCALPNCNLKNSIANDLKSLLSAAGDGVLLAFLIYAATHPDQAASDVQRVLTPIGNGIADAFRAVISL